MKTALDEVPTCLYHRICSDLCERHQPQAKITARKAEMTITNVSPATDALYKVIEYYQPTSLTVKNSHLP